MLYIDMKKSRFLLKQKENGFTLIEVMIYMAITGIITTAAVSYFINTMESYNLARNQLVLSNNELLITEKLAQDLRYVDDIDDANSVFANDDGKFVAVIDGDSYEFSIDAARLVKSVNGGTKIPVTANDVLVNKFRIGKVTTSSGIEQAEITIEFESVGSLAKENQKTSVFKFLARPRVVTY